MPNALIDWAALAPRERDAHVAVALFGYTLDYDALDVLGAPAVRELRDRYDEWGILPHYTADPTDARAVEDEIDRRGLGSQYAGALAMIAGDVDLWTIIRATPAQRCHAAMVAIGACTA